MHCFCHQRVKELYQPLKYQWHTTRRVHNPCAEGRLWQLPGWERKEWSAGCSGGHSTGLRLSRVCKHFESEHILRAGIFTFSPWDVWACLLQLPEDDVCSQHSSHEKEWVDRWESIEHSLKSKSLWAAERRLLVEVLELSLLRYLRSINAGATFLAVKLVSWKVWRKVCPRITHVMLRNLVMLFRNT